MKYRLGIDIGATSLGWCLLTLNQDKEPLETKAIGVRIFSDGREEKTKEPLAVTRRNARSVSRRIERSRRRRDSLMNYMIQVGLMPQDEDKRRSLVRLNPYTLRAKALDEKVEFFELGRALFHINERRGFKSNRKSDKKNKEKGVIQIGIDALRDRICDKKARTLGEYLNLLNEEKPVPSKNGPAQFPTLRARPSSGKIFYTIYPERSMYENEVDLILKTQEKYHKQLTADVQSRIKEIIFYQRPLKQQQPGLCTFEYQDEQPRALRALPLSQRFRVWQEINNLEARDSECVCLLTQEMKMRLAAELFRKKEKTFDQIRRFLQLDSGFRFNLESDRRDKLKGDAASSLLSGKKYFGDVWWSFPEEKKVAIITNICREVDDGKLTSWLQKECGLSEDRAKQIANADIDDGFGRLSEKAMSKILPYLEKGYHYHEACQKAGYHHSEKRTGGLLEKLPYYGEALPNRVIPPVKPASPEEMSRNPELRYGRIPNPTVHIGLNQLRKLMNSLIETYGKPEEIVVELARDLKLSEDEKNRIRKEQAENQKNNQEIDEKLRETGLDVNPENRMKVKIWQSLSKDAVKRCCPYTGKTISLSDLFTNKFEVEHLVPFSISYNDSINNKVIACTEANRFKANRTPYEAFGHSPRGYEWGQIKARIENSPAKIWAFHPDVLEKLKGKEESIIARQLTDTQYLSRLTNEYLGLVCKKAHVIPGRLTAMLRGKWGLNRYLGDTGEKNREDHRHHSIDAFVVACTTSSMLQKISSASENPKRRERMIDRMPNPFEGFVPEQFGEQIKNIIVSCKPDHGGAEQNIKKGKTTGRLHAETAYGFAGYTEDGHSARFIHRAPLMKLLSHKNIEEVADKTIKDRLKATLKDCQGNSEDWKRKMEEFGERWNIRHIGIVKKRSVRSMVGIFKPGQKREKGAQPYKYYELRGNYCAEIYCPNKGKKAGNWSCEITPVFYANQKDYIPNWRKENPTAKLIMRLFMDDMVAFEEAGQIKICRVKKMTGEVVYLREHHIAKEEANKKSKKLSARQLQQKKARKISVDILGRVKDPLRAFDEREHSRDNSGKQTSSS